MRNKFVNKIILTAFIVFGIGFSSASFAAEKNQQKEIWRKVEKNLLQSRASVNGNYEVFRLDQKALKNILAAAPLEFSDQARNVETILEIPTPDGNIVRFRLEESPMLSPEVAAQFPDWKTFQGRGIDDPTATARFDINANGFHGYVIGERGTFVIDPYSLNDKKNYVVYYKGTFGGEENFSCNFKEDERKKSGLDFFTAPNAFSNGAQLRNYRLAMSATKEYTTFFNNNVTSAFAGVQTTVNRMITVYRRELAVTFTLVSDTRTVFTTANNGGFPDASAGTVAEDSLKRSPIVLDTTYGKLNYDIGHVLSRTGNPNGLALSPSLCSNDSSEETNPALTAKAQGFTGAPVPQGDGFDVDYVAHEIGHQFAMSHTFNNDADGSCSTRSADSSYEPASGITIMGYGGICAPRNLAANSIEYFNLRSFDQTLNYMTTTADTTAGCGTRTATNNAPPTVAVAAASYNIPKQTPFTLTATGSDANNDSLTYLWEEFDLGAATRSTGAVDTDEDGTARPIFRAYNPTTGGSRTFPSLYYILNNQNTPPLTYTGTLPFAPSTNAQAGYVCAANETCVTGERLPSISRTMNFRVTVRDNNANGGGVSDAQTQVVVNAAAGPFIITSQNSAATVAGNSAQTVTWNVAGTNANGINAANVRISLSIDGGQTFPTVLAASTANDGTQQVTIPNAATTQARIKVEAVGNIFFDISNANFTITATAAPTSTVRSDFDGDGRTDLSVFRPTEGNWYLNRSTSGFAGVKYGTNGDVIVPADYDGDRKTDFAVFRPSNADNQPDFYVLKSADFTISGAAWGIVGDIPVVADYDGDNKADFAVWRPATGDFYVLQSQTNSQRHYRFGANGDAPVPADYDGDGKTDFAVFRPSNGVWYIARSTDNSVIYAQWGIASDIPVFADYDGDAKVDIAVFRPSNGVWYIQKSTGGISYVTFGSADDVPVPGDYDGDGKYDQAVYRGGIWYQNNSATGFAAVTFGLASDVPAPKGYLFR